MDAFTAGLLARIKATEADLARARDEGDDFLVEVEQAELDDLRRLARQHAGAVRVAAGARGDRPVAASLVSLRPRPAPAPVPDVELDHEYFPGWIQRARHAALLKEACPPADVEDSAAKLRALAEAHGIDVDAQTAVSEGPAGRAHGPGSGNVTVPASYQVDTAEQNMPADGPRPTELADLVAVTTLIETGMAEGQISGDEVRRAFEADQIPVTQWKRVLHTLNALLDAHGVTLMVSRSDTRARRSATNVSHAPYDSSGNHEP
ncbi:hypothetical protein ACGFR6_27545 [Streptomyces sp. NPDC048567]|uniref:hypothetical protein n=1 Tax=Streptomyces sp. NPDC048567 TaxID=3365570 RepID=UPI00371EB46F